MVRYLLRMSYIGTKYRGSQKTPGYPKETIQGILESALKTIDSKTEPLSAFASRTDKGVHALMNTCHVDLEHKISGEVFQPSYIKSKVNSYFKQNNEEIILTNVAVVPDNFHARKSAKCRSYIYRLAILKPELNLNYSNKPSFVEYLPITEINRCHIVPGCLNTDLVKEVGKLYHGLHDFTTFTKYIVREPWKNPQRFIQEFEFYESSHLTSFPDQQALNFTMWEFFIQSKAFLYHQIRKLVGTALSVGFGILSLDDVKLMLEKPGADMWIKSLLPPACGLYLSNVAYDKQEKPGADMWIKSLLPPACGLYLSNVAYDKQDYIFHGSSEGGTIQCS
ncbi:tRNA pseudouridine synthase-like 1 [Uloborus diversus]|uniref:tRNA pseudouridine synthase-like 1 n=1 Tax=Uloborus diversus TaxID=327109 RepID=UPI0024098D59|nr:tRNA pseudouridine synthase-like 1 [Uloborus diversus]